MGLIHLRAPKDINDKHYLYVLLTNQIVETYIVYILYNIYTIYNAFLLPGSEIWLVVPQG